VSTRISPPSVKAIVARELAFVMNHTIHHQAIIALLLEFQGREPLDDRFGYAPSTPSRA